MANIEAELKKAAHDCLVKAFKGDNIPAHVVQAAVAILLAPTYPD